MCQTRTLSPLDLQAPYAWRCVNSAIRSLAIKEHIYIYIYIYIYDLDCLLRLTIRTTLSLQYKHVINGLSYYLIEENFIILLYFLGYDHYR